MNLLLKLPSCESIESGDDESILTVSSRENFERNPLFHSKNHSNDMVKYFRIRAELFECEGFRSPTMRKARNMMESIRRMSNLQELGLHGKMSLDNIHDVEILKDAIAHHPNLRSINMEGFVVYAMDHPDIQPLLEPLLSSALTVSKLQCVNLTCYASYKRWDRAYCSPDVLRSLCQMKNLERLSLSGIGLQDQHFLIIAQELQGSGIRELVLNNNKNSDSGARAIVGLLETNNLLERLETHNQARLTESTCEYIAQQLERNYDIKHFSGNVHHDYRTKIDFYLHLNRVGRKSVQDANPEKFIDTLSAVDNNVSVIMRLLQENPSVFQQCAFNDKSSLQV
jgi:hypothetical protein